jgi:hypothetical protein
VSRAAALALVAALSACARPTPPAPAAAPAPVPLPAPAAAAAPQPLDDEAASGPEEPLVGEERERDPRSETVTIKLFVEPRRPAHVIWGVKDLGVAPLEITRPRDTGPLDLVVMAPGYLPLHTRAFTDRDDKITVHLYAETEAPGMLGYRAEPRKTP